MKKLLCFLIVTLFIMAACTKTDRFDQCRYNGDMMNNHQFYSQIIVVKPDQDGDGDDTKEFLSAINGCKPGSLIRLTEGVYHLSYMQIFDFHGSIEGAGQGKTIIYPVTPLAVKAQFESNLLGCWIRMIGGEINISKMTISTDVTEPVHDYNEDPSFGKDLFTMFIFADYNVDFRPAGTWQKVTIKDVSFIGGTDNGEGGAFWSTDHNTLLGIWCGEDFSLPLDGVVYPLISGEFKFSGCNFEHLLDAAEGFSLGARAKMIVNECKINNCYWPLYFTANYNSQIEITNNEFSNSTLSDITLEDFDWGFLANSPVDPDKPCHYNISGNTFDLAGDYTSITLRDYWVAIDPAYRAPMKISIKDNVFNMKGASSGIWALNSQDAVICNNRFTGECTYGILVDGTSVMDAAGTEFAAPFADNALLIGNNFKGLTSTADILLGEKSANCTVVGTDKESVVDNGVDNTVTGMRKVHGDHHMTTVYGHHFMNFHDRRQH